MGLVSRSTTPGTSVLRSVEDFKFRPPPPCRDGGDPKKQNSNLPPEKQYLITRNGTTKLLSVIFKPRMPGI